jgi:simple sugar transport system substrate-binding protein
MLLAMVRVQTLSGLRKSSALLLLTLLSILLAPHTEAQDNQLTFAMVSFGGPGIPFFRPVIKGMEDACTLLEAECHWLSDPSFGGFEAVTGYWDDALALNPDGIGTTAVGIGTTSHEATSLVRAGVERAAELGIPVIIFGANDPNAGTDQALPTLFSIGADEFSAGASNARRVFAEAEANGVTIHRGVCATHGIGIAVFDERCAAVESVFTEEGVPLDVLEIVWNDPLATRDILANYFADHPDANAIFAVGPEVTSGLNLYIQQAGLPPRQLYATAHDTSTEILQMIREGYLLQTYDQMSYMQGFQTIMSLYLASQFGIRPSSNIDTGTVVDQSNVDQVSELVAAGYR